MNGKTVLHYLGLVLRLQALFMAPSMLIALYYGEYKVSRSFAAVMVVMVLASIALDFVSEKKTAMFLRESFVVVSLGWVAISVTGAFPFWLSGEIPSFVDALFESVSGYTTTGATILTNVEVMSNGLLFWRSFTHWVGGMGVLVFLIAVVPFVSGERNLNVMKAESPGPAPGKLVPKLRQSSSILYGIYFGMTVLLFLFLLCGGMPLFDSVANALATAGTGGFGLKNASIAGYGSVYFEVVIGIFMVLFGVNFNIYYFLLIRNLAGIRANDEVKTYLGVVAFSTLAIAVNLTGPVYARFGESLRYAFFQVGAVISTTGFSTTDFSLWPQFSKAILFLLLLTGACGGSTSGGLKISRIIILARAARRRLYHMTHPRGVKAVKLDGKVVEPEVVSGVFAYVSIYAVLAVVSLLIVAADNFDFETTFTSVLTCLGNVGPGYGMISPAGNFSAFSSLSKGVFVMNMLLGRLELYPLLILLAPHTWKRMS